ncbi:MAG TPA: cytochrome c oxidase subunit 4 [Microbacteriaceae bacterium]|nr:cytochrome c oxidase subunit 4 [Microbacteriaceae bacterium]
MRANIVILWLLAAYFFLAAAVYGFWTNASSPVGMDWAGTIAIALSGILAAFIAFYLRMVHRSQGGELPEDRLDADIDDGDPELGYFSPWSWWPILFAAAAAIVFTGLAVGFWLIYIGVPLMLVTLVGWVYEYYRGNFGR